MMPLGGVLAIALALLFGWLCLRDFNRGVADFPRPYFTVAKAERPKLFWAITMFNLALVCGLFAGGVGLVRK